MSLRYHFFYYAISFILATLAYRHHIIFIIPLLIYICFIFYKLGYKHAVLLICLSFLVLIQTNQRVDSEYLEGNVYKVYEHSFYLKTTQGRIKVVGEHNFSYGDYIEITVEPTDMTQQGNDYAFDEETYLKGQNIHTKVKLDTIIDCQSHVGLYTFIKNRFQDNEEVRSYQNLLILGEKDDYIEGDYDMLKDISLIHLFALSGLHIQVLYGLLIGVLAVFIPKEYAKIIVIICIGYYVFSIPPSLSLQRAFYVLVLKHIFDQWLNSLDILSILVILMLLYNPYYIYNLSFIFSYFIYFIVLLTQKMKYSSFLIYLSTVPILLSTQYELSLLTFGLGLYLMPVVKMIYSLLVLVTCFPFLGVLSSLAIYAFKTILSFLSHNNMTLVIGKVTLSFIVLYYIIYFSMLYSHALKRGIVKYILILCSLFMMFHITLLYRPYAEFIMIDVGQGDCFLLKLPFNQGTILFDTGGQRNYDLAVNTIIPFLKAEGISTLDYVIISHDDYDHNGALESLISNYHVKEIIDNYREPLRIGTSVLTFLKPSLTYDDSNDNSLVVLIEVNDINILMTGDISTEVEKDLLKTYSSLNVDILKVAHHGSSTSTGVDLMSLISPRIAMISVKKNNIYKHPSSSVINRLERKGIQIFRTDQDGMCRVRIYRNKYYIYT